MALDVTKDAAGGLGHDAGDWDHQGMHVTFQDVVYTVRHHKDRSQRVNILKGISGAFRPGQMAATMGPSGSGKARVAAWFCTGSTSVET